MEKVSSETLALKRFKGIESNKKVWIVHKVQRVLIEVKQIYLKD